MSKKTTKKVVCMRFSDRGGGRRSMHPSKSTTVPVIVFIVLLCDLPLPSTTSSTRSPRSCHVTVAGDRIALPASMTRRPAVVAGPVDSAGTPHTAYTTGGQASAPCRQSCRASAQHRPTRAPVAGKRSSLSKFDPIHEQWQRRYSPKRRPPSCRP